MEANFVCIGSNWKLLLNGRLELDMKLLRGLNVCGRHLERSLKIRILVKPEEFLFDEPSLMMCQESMNELRQLLPIVFKFSELRHFIAPLHTWKLTRAFMLTEEIKFDFAESDISVYVQLGDRRMTIMDMCRTKAILRLNLHQWREILAHESAHKLTDVGRAKRLRYGQVPVAAELNLPQMYTMRFSDSFGNELRTKLAIRTCCDEPEEDDGTAGPRVKIETAARNAIAQHHFRAIDSDSIYMCQAHAWTGLVRLLEFLLEFVRYDEAKRQSCKNRFGRNYRSANDD